MGQRGHPPRHPDAAQTPGWRQTSLAAPQTEEARAPGGSATRRAAEREMRFWDTSALLPLLIQEDRTEAAKAMYDEDSLQAVWCLAEVEVASALARRGREGLSSAGLEDAR